MADIFNRRSLNNNQEKLRKDSPYYTDKIITTTSDQISVTDADSFGLFTDGFRGPTRLYGVDAPETSIYEKAGAKTRSEREQAKKKYKEQRKNIGKRPEKMFELSQDYGAESTSIAKEFINNATEIHVNLKQMDASGGRRIVEVFNQDGESLSTHLVAEGAAFAELPTSSDFDGSRESFERYELMKKAYKEGKGLFADDDFVSPKDFREGNNKEYYKKTLDIAIKVDEFKERGIGNNQYAYVLADADTYFTLPASLGASYFHGANLEHNLMEQNGYQNLARSTHYKGLAESMMEYNHYLLEGKELSTFERFAARSYDSGLQAGGVGNWLNREIFIPRGWGRVYKDEKGAVASIAGLAGKILDESYMYYANLNPDWALIGKDFQEGVGYGALEDPQQGIFQTTFENLASFGESMAQSLGMYLAITAPAEMLGAGMAKDFLDQTIKGTMVENTRLNALDSFDSYFTVGPRRTSFAAGRQPGYIQRFMAEFFLGDMGHQVQARPGGMTAAILEERFRLDNEGGGKAFFDHGDGPKTGFHAMQVIKRGRARAVLEGTFKPFLIDLVNPFDGTLEADRWIKDPTAPGGRRQGNAYDEFNLRVNKLIDIIAAPVDLKVKIIKGESAEFQGIKIEDELNAAKEKTGRIVVRASSNKTAVHNYTQLKEQYETYAKKIDDQMVKNNDELIEILKKNGLTEVEARHYVFQGNTYKGKKPEFLDRRVQKEVELKMANRTEYLKGKNALRSQLGSYADKLETITTNSGISYKTSIAAGVQDILNMMPLNPMKWGMVNRSAANADEFLAIGELFSFKHASEFTAEVITGENSITRVFAQFEPVVPDPVVDGKFITKMEHISNVTHARMKQIDRVAGVTWDSIKRFFSGAPKSGPNIDAMTQKMRASERAIAKAATKQTHAEARKAARAAREGGNYVAQVVEGFKFQINNLGSDVTRHSAEVVVGDVGEESVKLLEDILDYTHEVRGAGGLTAKGISVEDMSAAMGRSGIKDVTSEIMDVTNKFSGNIKAEKFLKGSTGYIAGAVFISLALNNIMQSTGGVSISSQIGFALFGEDEDIAVRFEGNRFLPTEILAQATGLNQTAVNLVADTVMIGGTLAIANKVARNIKTKGYMPYTFDQETIYKMAEDARFEFVIKEGSTIKTVQKDYLTKMVSGKDNVVYLRKNTGQVDDAGRAIIKETLLTRSNSGFRSERVLQSFAKNVPTKTFIFGSIALLAMEGARKAAGTLLQAMAESPDDKNFLVPAAGMAAGAFAIGAFLEGPIRPSAAEASSEVIQRAGGQIRTSFSYKKGLRGGGKWLMGAAMAASAVYVGKLVLDPNIEQKGSLDPIVAGAAFGIGVGIMKKSVALAGMAGIAALSVMSAINWAGIRFLEVGRAGTEVDPHTAKLVAQLSQYSTAVLESEKDSVMFHTMMAAYAGQFSAGKSILAEDPQAVAGEVQVIAKQSPLPFLQFFVAERIKGPRGDGFVNGGPDNERTVRSYSLGIQSGALFGTSLSVELPVTYTPGQGFFGFTYNEDNNLMAVPNFAIKVGVWAAAATGGVGITYRFGSFLSSTAYNMTKLETFARGAEDFARGADDLFEASKFMLGAAEKISTFFIRHTVGIFATLQGTDARMAYETYKNSASKVQAAADKLQDTSITTRELSLMDTGDNFDDISGIQKGWKEITDSSLGSKILRSKHLAVGLLVGSIVGSMIHEVEKQRVLASTYEAGASYETIARVEEEVEKRKILYIVAGGAAGGLLNDIRTGMGLIEGVGKNQTVRSAYKRVLASTPVAKTRFIRKARVAIRRMRRSSVAKNFQSKVLNNKISKGVASTVRSIMSKKVGRYGAVFLAAMAFNYVRTNSKFGITTMMDRFIDYDERGNAYDDYELQTSPARLHQFAVIGLTSAYHTAIISAAGMPHLSQRQTMLNVVQRKIDAIDEAKDAKFFKKVQRTAKNIVLGVHYAVSERETGRLLQNLLTLDSEADQYEAFLNAKDKFKEAGGKGRPPTLDPKLQKIEDVLKLRKALDKKELMEYMSLEAKRRGKVKLTDDELEIYKKFLHKASDVLGQADNLKHLSRGYRQTAKYMSFAGKATGVLAISYGLGWLITTGLNQGGEVGTDSYLDRIYNRANQGSKFGQRGPNGKLGSIVDGTYHVVADFLRLVTNRDIVDINYAVDALNGKMVKTTGQRLVSNAKGVREAQQTVADLSEMVIFDNPNAYIATFDFGGRTLRAGDKGVTTSTYFQLQGPAQDISTATYSMAAKFIFNKYTAGKGRLATLIDRGMRDFDPNDPSSFNKAALTIRNATGMLHAMKTSRKYSRATAETAATFAQDSMVSAILAKRQEALAHQAWQPVDSLFTNMFFETVDKAKHRGQDNAVLGFLEGIAKNQRDVLEIFSDLMAGGVFENFFRRTSISNVKFFSGSFGKPPKKSGPQHMVADISALWHQTHDLSVQAEMFKQSRVEILDNFVDKVASPMFNHSIFAILPDWVKIGGVAMVSIGLTAVITQGLARFTQMKTERQQTGEMLEFFGRKDSVGATALDVAPEDINQIKKQLRRNIQNGGKMKWEADTRVSTDDLLVLKGTKAQQAAGDLKARNQLIMSVSQNGKKEMLRFEISAYTNHFDEAELDNFIKFVQQKGDDIRNIFNYADPSTGSKMNIAHALSHEDSVKKFLQSIGADPNVENIYDIFRGTSSGALTKDGFILRTVEDFQSKFQKGLDKMYNLSDELDVNNSLFQEVTVTIEGKQKTFLAGELLDPKTNIGNLESEFGELGDSSQGPSGRKQMLMNKYKQQVQKFQDRVEIIVKEEMDNMEFNPRNLSAEDQVKVVQTARKKALNRIKAEVADAGTEMGQIARGLGIVEAHALPDERAAREAATRGIQPEVTRQGDSFLDEAIEAIQYQRPKGSVTFWDSLGIGGKGLMTAGFTIFDVLTGGDIIGSFLRVAEAYSSPYASDLDVKMAEKEMGRAVLTSLVGLAAGFALGGLTKLGNNEFIKSALKNPKTWFFGIMGAGAIGIVAGASYKGIIAPAMKRFSKYVDDTKILRKAKQGWDNVWFATGDAVGHMLAAPVSIGYKLAGKKGAYATAGFIGGTLGGAVFALGSLSLVKAGAAALGMAAVGIGALPLAITALGIGAVVGVAAFLMGDKLTSGFNYTTREIMKVPFIGAMSGMTDPYRQIRNQRRFQHHFVNSPFLLGYVGDIVNNNWLTTLAAAEDHTGRDQVSNIFGEILAEGEGYGEAHSAWKRQAADGLIGRPKPIVDDVIQQELRIRGEFYSDNVVGRYSWDQLVKYSDNSGAIRAMEAKNRAERIRIQEAARVKIMKAAMEAGGPREAMTTGSARKAAVVGIAAARVEQVYKDLDTDTSAIKVTAASVTTHKSNVKNSDQKQADQVKQMTASVTMAPLTLDEEYTARIYIDSSTATVDYEKSPSDMNPILQQEAQVITGGKAKTPEQQAQADTYNSYKDES